MFTFLSRMIQKRCIIVTSVKVSLKDRDAAKLESSSLKAFACLFGCDEVTPNQVADRTGFPLAEILAANVNPYHEDFRVGWFAARTCSPEKNLAVNFPAYRGRLQFWLGATEAMSSKIVTPSTFIRDYVAQQHATPQNGHTC
jgi:hypothetical protein